MEEVEPEIKSLAIWLESALNHLVMLLDVESAVLGAKEIAVREADRISACIKIDNNTKCKQVPNARIAVSFTERIIRVF